MEESNVRGKGSSDERREQVQPGTQDSFSKVETYHRIDIPVPSVAKSDTSSRTKQKRNDDGDGIGAGYYSPMLKGPKR